MSATNAADELEPSVSKPPNYVPKGEQTRGKLVAVGVDMFTRIGYNATSTRQVETQAGVKRNLISYHFGNKEEFWKACMTELFQKMMGELQPAIERSPDSDPYERIRFMIRRFVLANAAHPGINRIMFDVSRNNSWQLEWIVDHYGRGFYKMVLDLFNEGQNQHILPDLSPAQFYYLLIGSTAMFSMAAECQLLTGEDPINQSMVEAHADAVATLLTNRQG